MGAVCGPMYLQSAGEKTSWMTVSGRWLFQKMYWRPQKGPGWPSILHSRSSCVQNRSLANNSRQKCFEWNTELTLSTDKQESSQRAA